MFKYNKGYTLLFAIIVSSIVLSVAVFIISSSRRQLILSSMAKDSTMAMYAADGAMQCAVMAYYDGKLATTSGSNYLSCFNTMLSSNPSSSFSYTPITGSATDPSMNIKDGFVYEATVKRMMPNNTCAIIKIVYGIDRTTGNTKTVIDSLGYNMANYEPCITNGKYNPRVIERGIRTQFNM